MTNRTLLPPINLLNWYSANTQPYSLETRQLPAEWGTKANVTVFSCVYCQLMGTLPPEWDLQHQIATSVHTLQSSARSFTTYLGVQYLVLDDCVLYGNQLNGTLPSYNLVDATKVNDAIFEGSARSKLYERAKPFYSAVLRSLNLEGNLFSGSFPTEWVWAMPYVNFLNLRANRLNGSLPELPGHCLRNGAQGNTAAANNLMNTYLGNMVWSNLQTLLVPNNQFSGTLPVTWLLHQNLLSFDVGQTSLEGQLPETEIPNLDTWEGTQKVPAVGSPIEDYAYLCPVANVPSTDPVANQYLGKNHMPLQSIRISHCPLFTGTFPTTWFWTLCDLITLEVYSVPGITGPIVRFYQMSNMGRNVTWNGARDDSPIAKCMDNYTAHRNGSSVFLLINSRFQAYQTRFPRFLVERTFPWRWTNGGMQQEFLVLPLLCILCRSPGTDCVGPSQITSELCSLNWFMSN